MFLYLSKPIFKEKKQLEYYETNSYMTSHIIE